MLDKRVVVFHGFELPDVEVRRDGAWHSGELRSWHQTEAGWTAMVRYNVGRRDDVPRAGRLGPGATRLVEAFAEPVPHIASEWGARRRAHRRLIFAP